MTLIPGEHSNTTGTDERDYALGALLFGATDATERVDERRHHRVSTRQLWSCDRV